MSPRIPLVMLADDDEEERRALRGMLSAYELVESVNGKKALEHLTSGAPEPDLIVLNLSVPVMNGWEFLQLLKSYVRLALIPVILISEDDPYAH